MQSFKAIPFYLRFLSLLFAIGLLLLALLRLALMLFSAEHNLNLGHQQTWQAFAVGAQFDSVILAYTLIIPFLLLALQSFLKLRGNYFPLIAAFLIGIVYTLFIFTGIAEIPYFNFFRNRLSESAFQWLNAPDVVWSMIVSNTNHLVFLVLSILFSLAITFLTIKLSKRWLLTHNWAWEQHPIIRHTLFFIIGAMALFMGMRGRMDHPIRQGDAFYCNDPFLNQMGLNPMFTLIKSYTDKVNLMNDDEALRNTQTLLNINNPEAAISPLAHYVADTGKSAQFNVVLVLMESMSADYMGAFGSHFNVTPNLDSIAAQSWLFTNAYSAGIHTNNGIFSTLFSFPALKRTRPMSTIPARTYSGIPYTLKQAGYRNYFFSTHDAGFDNIGTFIPHNFFDELHTSEKYPPEKVIGPFGVPDDYLFTYAIKQLNTRQKQPFFATILTTSNHDPYILPDYFKTSITDPALKAVSYADWSIGKFMDAVKQQPWYKNTIFIFCADHGLRVKPSPYDLSLSYNHIPIIIHAPEILGAPQKLTQLTGQIDVFPMLMDILNMNYTNNTLGLNALKQHRPYMYFSADDKIGCINEEWLYVYRYEGRESLYHFKDDQQAEDLASLYPEQVKAMKSYALSQTQTSEWMFVQNKTALTGKH